MSDKNHELLIKNARIVSSEACFAGDIIVDNGRISAICTPAGQTNEKSFCRVIDAAGRTVTPGGVDIHCHLQYHVGGFDTADDFANGTAAAACGGTTTVMDFVEAGPQESMLEALEKRRAQAQAGALGDFSLHMSVLPHDLSRLQEIKEVVDYGCPSFKHYMAYAFALEDGQLLQSFRAIAENGGLAIVHAENWSVISRLIAEHLLRGQTHARYHTVCRPAALEAQAVQRCLDLARLSAVKLFIFHISCHEAASVLLQARQSGLNVEAETCSHYLRLDNSIFESMGNLPICSPPIREATQKTRLAADLSNGTLQSVSSDHCPFTRAEKNSAEVFCRVPGGLSSIETRMMLVQDLPAMTEQRWVEVCCTAPARIAGLTQKGSLTCGKDADIVIWGKEPYTISAASLHEAADWSPFEGLSVSRRPDLVISRGEVIVDQQRITGQAGRGQWQKRTL